MAGAIAAFKEAFSSYKRNFKDYFVYSLVVSLAAGVMALSLAAFLLIIGVLSTGGIAATMMSGNGISLGLVGIGATVLILAVSVAAFAWLQGGLIGAYLDTINGILSGRKQSMGGLFAAIPRFASGIFVVSILSTIIACIPLAAFAVIGGVLKDQAVGVSLIIIGIFFAMLIGALFIFAVPAVVVDRKGALAAVSGSFFKVTRNVGSVAVYLAVCIALALPNIIPLFSLLYVPVFYMPFTYAALLLLYKRAN